MPKTIQKLVDDSKFLQAVYRKRKGKKTLYIFEFRDSFEVWYRIYDSKGNKVRESAYLPLEH
jgi:hypothetical protein